MDSEWGYAVMADGTKVPLEPPEGMIPEEHRQIVHKSKDVTMWVDKRSEEPNDI